MRDDDTANTLIIKMKMCESLSNSYIGSLVNNAGALILRFTIRYRLQARSIRRLLKNSLNI